MSVAPRWKRRADEIAEAIGDELSVNGTVSIGNDVNLSVATISALANAITNVLNPLSIAASVWGVHGDYGVCRATQDPSDQNYWFVYSSIGHQVSHIHDSSGTTIPPSANSLAWVYRNNNQWQLFDGDVVRNVSVVSTNTTPVHVQVRNIAGGFTAMGSDISTSMKLSAQPVSIADTVNVKTATGEAVAITGTVNLNVGSSTVPISNPNNITVPVVNTNSVTVPVSLGSVTVPIKATTAGIPQNASGVSVFVPVDGNHSVTVPVSVGSTTVPASVPSALTVPASVPSGLTVPVAVGSNTVPVAVGSATVPVAVGSVVVPVRTVTGTTNAADGTGAAVVVPVDTSATVLNVKIVEISTVAPSGGVAPTEAFEAAMEDAINDAEELTGVIVGPNTHTTASVAYTPVWDILGSDGVTYTSQYLAADSPQDNNTGSRHVHQPQSSDELSKYLGRRVTFNTNATAQWAAPQANGKEWLLLTDGVTVSGGSEYRGSVVAAHGTTRWQIRSDDGFLHTDQILYHEGAVMSSATVAVANAFHGHRVVRHVSIYVGNYWLTEVIEV